MRTNYGTSSQEYVDARREIFSKSIKENEKKWDDLMNDGEYKLNDKKQYDEEVNKLSSELKNDYSTFLSEELIRQTDPRLNTDSNAMRDWGCAYRVSQAVAEIDSLLNGGKPLSAIQIKESIELNIEDKNTVSKKTLKTPNMVGVANNTSSALNRNIKFTWLGFAPDDYRDGFEGRVYNFLFSEVKTGIGYGLHWLLQDRRGQTIWNPSPNYNGPNNRQIMVSER